MRKFFMAMAGIAAIGLSGAAYASTATLPVVQLHNQVSLGATVAFQHYQEIKYGTSDTVLDSENGFLEGGELTFSGMQHRFGVNNLLVGLRLAYLGGHTNYAGSTQGGTPVHSTTINQIPSISIRIGKGFLVSNDLLVTPYATYGHRKWGRAAESTPNSIGYKEYYNNDYAGLGAMVDYQITPRLIVSGDVMVGSTFNANMHTDFGGMTPEMHFNLGDKVLYRASVAADYRVARSWHAYAKLGYLHMGFGQSAINQYGWLEPNSTTQDVSLTVGVRHTL